MPQHNKYVVTNIKIEIIIISYITAPYKDFITSYIFKICYDIYNFSSYYYNIGGVGKILVYYDIYLL